MIFDSLPSISKKVSKKPTYEAKYVSSDDEDSDDDEDEDEDTSSEDDDLF